MNAQETRSTPNGGSDKSRNTATTVAAILLALGSMSIGYGLCQVINGLTSMPALMGTGTICCSLSAVFFSRAAKQT